MRKRKIIPYNPKLTALARQLRNNATKSEIFLWLKLKGKQMYGYDFHRQKPIDNYILDFFCYRIFRFFISKHKYDEFTNIVS